MNNHAQQVAHAKGFRDGLNNFPNRNPYKSLKKSKHQNPCYRQYNHGYDLGKQALTEHQARKEPK